MPHESTLALLEDQLNILRQQYARRLPARLDAIEETWRTMEAAWDPAVLSALYQAVHTLAGSGTTFGFTALSKEARILETFLHAIIQQGAAVSEAQAAQIDIFIDRLSQASHNNDMRQTQPVEPVVISPPPAPVVVEQVRIFVVVPDEPWVSELTTQLSYFGYTCDVFNSVRTALAASRDRPPAAMLIDYAQLDTEDESAAMIREMQHARLLPMAIIFLAEQGDLQSRLAAARVGGQAYFTKPLDLADIIDKLDVLTSHHAPDPYRVMIVDDDAILTDYFSQLLTQAGMTTCIVNEPLSVIAPLSEFRPDVILMDVYMPGCSGLELAAVIRQQPAYVSIPLLFLTSETNVDRHLTAIGLGADDFLQKPIEPEYLISWVVSRAQRARTLRSFMVNDSLTNLFNHRKIKDQLSLEVARATRSGSTLTLAMLDLDRFKIVNDTYGHLVGDRVIKRLARLLQQRLRKTDVLGRYGGEEFVVILPDTPLSGARLVMEQITATFAQIKHRADQGEFVVTVSCGLASFPGHEGPIALTRAADDALYAAKRGGRNCVRVWSEQG